MRSSYRSRIALIHNASVVRPDLLAAALILDGLTEWGFDALFAGVVRELYVNGETKDSIKHKISKYPITKKLKRRLMWEVENFRAA